ncbi:hypothetical protein F4777DRAFT_8169 [Nemania sp. FL0916]|nr:hypothetical protein F4777DRAFT_8169 [Nemania sp. FL0916]
MDGTYIPPWRRGQAADNEGPDVELFRATLEINDYPQAARAAVTDQSNIERILEATGTRITTQGMFYPPGREVLPGGVPKLYILVQGNTELAVVNAKAELTRLLRENTSGVANATVDLIRALDQITSAAADADSQAPTGGPFEPPSQYQQQAPNNRGADNGRSRPGRGGYRRGRGGSRRSNDDFYSYQRREAQIDESELYRQRDIHNYFWGDEGENANDVQSTTFHDSQASPGTLSYMLLFSGANPRWASDHIIFAKSKLALLPEYAAKKVENGDWEHHMGTGMTTKPIEGSSSDDEETAEVFDEQGTLPVTQATQATAGDDQTLSGPSRQEGSLRATQSNTDKDLTTSISTTYSAIGSDEFEMISEREQEKSTPIHGSANGFDEFEIISEREQEKPTPIQGSANGFDEFEIIPKREQENSTPSQDSVTGTQKFASSGEFGDDELEQFSSEGGKIQHEKQDNLACVEAEKTADHTVEATPLPTTSSNNMTSRPKYTDIRKEEGQFDATPDINSASEQYYKRQPLAPEPTCPTIAPIEYTPSSTHPIAVFEEYRTFGPRVHKSFAFRGWFRIARINILAPQSAELVRMLHQKWDRRDRFGNVIPTKSRNAAAWNTSLNMEWAVVGFELLKEGEGDGNGVPPPPKIEKLPGPEHEPGSGRPGPSAAGQETKTVNELIAQMRLDFSVPEIQKGGEDENSQQE